jgi:dTDP-4-amino-4,6-dideoxygalactose transaminase
LAPRLQPPRAGLFPLDREHAKRVQRFYLARAGVCHAAQNFLRGPARSVLMPAYHHGVEVEAVRAAGAEVIFYRVDAELRADLDDVRRKLASPAVCALYLTHFIGFAQPVAEAAQLARERGVKLIEDCALALLSRTPDGRPLGSFGDAAIFCLYKTLPVPHGGLLWAPAVPPRAVAAPPIASTLRHATGLLLAHFELNGGGPGRAMRGAARATAHRTVDNFCANVQTGTSRLDARDLELGASRLTNWLLRRIDLEMVAVRRRRNFRRLAEALDGVAPIVGAPLAPGVCPLFLPLRVRDKHAALAAVRARGIEAVDFWGAGDPEASAEIFPEAARLRREILELPCHQSLDDDAVDFVARAVKQVLAHV